MNVIESIRYYSFISGLANKAKSVPKEDVQKGLIGAAIGAAKSGIAYYKFCNSLKHCHDNEEFQEAWGKMLSRQLSQAAASGAYGSGKAGILKSMIAGAGVNAAVKMGRNKVSMPSGFYTLTDNDDKREFLKKKARKYFVASGVGIGAMATRAQKDGGEIKW